MLPETPKPAAAPRLMTGPVEIQILIANHLAIKDRKALRHVCRAFAVVGAESIFGKSLEVIETFSSLNRLMEITTWSTSPTFTSPLLRVKALNLWTIHRLPSIHVPDHHLVRETRIDVGAFGVAFQHLKNVDTINIKSLSKWSTSTSALGTRGIAFRDRLFGDGQSKVEICGRGLAAISAAIHANHHPIRHLSAEIGLNCLLDAETVTHVSYAFSQLETVNLRINLEDPTPPWNENADLNSLYPDETPDPKTVVKKRLLARAFEGARELRAIRLTFEYPTQEEQEVRDDLARENIEYSAWNSASLQDYLGKKAWPHLHTLYITELLIDAKSLLKVIERNSDTLKNFGLNRPVFRGDQWPDFLLALHKLRENGILRLEKYLLRGRCQWTWTPDLDFPSGREHPYKHTEDTRHVLADLKDGPVNTVKLGDEMVKYVLEGNGQSPWDFYKVHGARLQCLLVDADVRGNHDCELEKHIWGE